MPKKTAQNGLTEAETKPAKKNKGVPHNPQKDFGQENVEPGDNARYLRQALVPWYLPPIDISDPKQVECRINDYFQFCIENDKKPNMRGLGNWLGVDRSTVNSWKRGEYRRETHSPLIQKAVDTLEELWIDYMMNGKVNPASGIFLGKNFFEYKDVQEVVQHREDPLGEREDPEALRRRIMENTILDEDDESDG